MGWGFRCSLVCTSPGGIGTLGMGRLIQVQVSLQPLHNRNVSGPINKRIHHLGDLIRCIECCRG